jgi:RNA polymerase sigma-70 factor (ECF subfamily)
VVGPGDDIVAAPPVAGAGQRSAASAVTAVPTDPATVELCHRLADDLDAAFPDLVVAMRDDLYSGLRRLHHDAAEDLAQEAFLRAYRALEGYEPARIRSLRLRGWMWSIALNLGRNHARDRARRPTPVPLEDRFGTGDPEPADGRAWQRRLGALPRAQRDAVILRHVVGLTTAEIAQALDRPHGTVRSDIHRGLRHLRATMEEET